MRRYGYTSVILAVNIFFNFMATSEDFIFDTHVPYTSDYGISDVKFYPGDETLAMIDGGTLYLCDLKTKSITKSDAGGFGSMNNLFISNDGRYIAASTNYPFAYIIDGKTGKLLYRVQHDVPIGPHIDWHWLNSITFSPDSKNILTSFEKNICIWDTMTGKLLQQFDLDLTSTGWYAKYFPDGDKIIIESITDQKYSHKIVNLKTKNTENRSFFGSTTMFFSNDMKYIASLDYDPLINQNVIKIWNIETNEFIIQKEIPKAGSYIELSIDKMFVMVADTTNQAEKRCFLYNLNTESIVKEDFIDKNSEEYNQPIKVVRFSNDLKYAAVAIEGKLHVYDISSLTAHANKGFTLTK